MSEQEQRINIKFLTKLKWNLNEIDDAIHKVYGADAYSRESIRRWFNLFRSGRESVEDDKRTGRPPKYQLVPLVKRELDENKHASAREIAHILNISPSTVTKILREDLHLEWYHLRYVPHMLTPSQKLNRVNVAKQMLDILVAHRASGFHFIYTGDEKWFVYDTYPDYCWCSSQEEAGERPAETHFVRKTMLTLFFNGDGDLQIHVKEEGKAITAEDFVGNILAPLAQHVYPHGRRAHSRKYTVHYDNARPHIAKNVTDFLRSADLELLGHPAYSPDIAPCDFAIFGFLTHKLTGIHFQNATELIDAIQESLQGYNFKGVFEEWIDRLQKVIEIKGEYI